MMGRILTIMLFLGFTLGMNSAFAEQKELALDCQYSCSCKKCCADAGVNCNPMAEKGPSFQTDVNSPAAPASDLATEAR